MEQRANNRKADLIRNIVGRVESRLKKNEDKSHWRGGSDGVLGVKVQNEILSLCLVELKKKYSKQWIAARLFDRMKSNLPFIRGKRPTNPASRSAPLARSRWKVGTFRSWLTNNEVKPNPADALRVLDTLIDLAAENLVKHESDLEELKLLLRLENTTTFGMVSSIVHHTVIGDNASWSAPDGYEPYIASSLARTPEAVAPAPLLKTAEDIVDHLVGIDGPRLVMLTGPAHSGKKTAIRYLLSALENHHLKLVDGTLLPALALNLEELTPDEFVDQVFAFFRRGDYSRFEVSAEQMLASVKVEHIRQMALKTPAFVIFGEIGRIDADEIGRRLSGAYAEEIVSSLLEGHDLTRLVLASHDRSTGSFVRPQALLGDYSKPIELPGKIPQVPSTELHQLGLPGGVLASGLSWKLCHTALHLAGRNGLPEEKAALLKEDLKQHLECDRPHCLIRAIIDLLNDRQRLVVGMVCSSSDGLRFSVLQKMLHAFQGMTLDPAGPYREGETRALLGEVGILIQGRMMASDKVLVEFGALPQEDVLTANESWRYLYLTEWQRRDKRTVALVMLLIAREAAHQSRCLRVYAGARTPTSIGRDVQALHACVASAAFASLNETDVEKDSLLCSESDILPPLDVHVPVPPAKSLFRYAFRQLYARDLEGDDFQLLNVAEDARTRLRVLLTFLTPDAPWSLEDGLKPPSRDLASFRHLTDSLTPSEVIDLMASIGLAALRLQRFDILCAVCRLGEQVFEAASDRVPLMLNLMRLLRAELDAALLLGGNPDIYLEEKDEEKGSFGIGATRMTINDIIARLNKLLDEYFMLRADGERPMDVLMVRGKLHARLGEVLHAAGKLTNAGREFDKALEIEAEVINRLPPGASLSPVLGGRGRRSYLAYCIDRSLEEKFDALWATFIFVDELRIPISRRIPTGDHHIARATRSFELNTRRLHNGRASDKVGLQIDGARLAAVDHQYARAFRLLDAANKTRFGSGSSLEILLELFAIQTRYSLDAAMICLNKNAKDAIFASEDFIAGIADYFDLSKATSPLELAARLLERAKVNHQTYGRLALLHGTVMTPHVTYFRYLGALISAISSRMTDAPKDLLQRAHFQLEGVLKHLELSSFLLHLGEVKRVKNGIEECLRRYS